MAGNEAPFYSTFCPGPPFYSTLTGVPSPGSAPFYCKIPSLYAQLLNFSYEDALLLNFRSDPAAYTRSLPHTCLPSPNYSTSPEKRPFTQLLPEFFLLAALRSIVRSLRCTPNYSTFPMRAPNRSTFLPWSALLLNFNWSSFPWQRSALLKPLTITPNYSTFPMRAPFYSTFALIRLLITEACPTHVFYRPITQLFALVRPLLNFRQELLLYPSPLCSTFAAIRLLMPETCLTYIFRRPITQLFYLGPPFYSTFARVLSPGSAPLYGKIRSLYRPIAQLFQKRRPFAQLPM